MKTRVALIFGGRSVEHEVSVISGIQALKSMNEEKYDTIPVYMTKENDMYIGESVGDIKAYKDIPSLLKKSQKVIMVNESGRFVMVPYPMKKIGAKKPVSFDVVLPVVHGTNVEDGALQGFLKTLGVAFAGPDVTASAVGMDKFIMKSVLKEASVPVLDAKIYKLSDYTDIDNITVDIEKSIGYPVIIKPVNLGSSVGINIANNKDELINAIDDAFRYATKIIAEHAIKELREINCAVLGDENEAIASECEEPIATDEILSYEDKYVNGGKNGKSGKGVKTGNIGSKGMASVKRKIPADLTDEKREEIRKMAIKAFQALGCSGVSRIDFMIDKDTNELYFNEINTIPGSLAFYLWEAVGLSYTELLDRMIQLALKRQREENAVTFAFDTNILSNANV